MVWNEERRYPARHSTQRRAENLSSLLSPARIGRTYALAAMLEAFTWAGLLVGMFLEHVTHTTDMGVWLFGRLHGAAFMIYVAVTLIAAYKLRWAWWVALVALAASIPPLFTLIAEWWLSRTGRLSESGTATRPVEVASSGRDR